MLRNTPNAETLIVEYGFLDNAADAERLKTNYKDYADAVIEAVLDYKNIPYEKKDYYTVKKGDTLWSIANTNNTTVAILKNLNNLTTNSLSIGQQLKLPTQETPTPSYSNTYTVKSGDTLYSIAQKYGTTVSDLKNLNNLTTNTLSIGQTLKIKNNASNETIDNNNYYTVKKGDTLYSIAQKYDTTVSTLKNLNNLTTNTLSIGQTLKIPPITGNVYIVKKGDTLWSIAQNNNTTVNTLKELNNLINNSLTIGQQLLIS